MRIETLAPAKPQEQDRNLNRKRRERLAAKPEKPIQEPLSEAAKHHKCDICGKPAVEVHQTLSKKWNSETNQMEYVPTCTKNDQHRCGKC